MTQAERKKIQHEIRKAIVKKFLAYQKEKSAEVLKKANEVNSSSDDFARDLIDWTFFSTSDFDLWRHEVLKERKESRAI